MGVPSQAVGKTLGVPSSVSCFKAIFLTIFEIKKYCDYITSPVQLYLMSDLIPPKPEHESESDSPSLIKLLLLMGIGTLGVFLAIWLPDFLEQEEARKSQWQSEMGGLIQTILSTNTPDPVFEGLKKIRKDPGLTQAIEFSVVAEALLDFRYNQDSFDLAGLALKYVHSIADKLRFHKIQARAAFKMGKLDLGRSIYRTAVASLDSNGLPRDQMQMMEADKLVLLSKWIDQELLKGQCESAQEVLTIAQNMDPALLEGLPSFVQHSSNSIKASCQT